MLTAQLVLLFLRALHLASAVQIGLLAVVPLITQPLFMPWWARLFDGSHVVRYRARQGWALVLASLVHVPRGLRALAAGAVGRRRSCSGRPRRVLIWAGTSGTTISPDPGVRSTTWECT